MLRSRSILSCLALAPLALGAFIVDGVAQQAAPTLASPQPSKPPRNKYGSPLDTLMNTHLWTDVPPAQDFVTQTRPDRAKLDYTPLTGVDPDRPKPRDKANISALQAELEGDRTKNEAKGRVLRPTPKRKIKPPQP